MFPDSNHGNPPPIEWVELSSPKCPAQSHISNLQWQTLTFPTADLTYEALLLRPPPDHTPKPRLVVFPHGGPHVVIPAGYLVWSSSLVTLGFAVLLVNYRGSIGFGQEGIDSLPGKIGDQDVKDVHRAVSKVVANGWADSTRVCVMGGSHGGFLSTHLIGQYPDFYKAAAIRNPVIDLSTMWASSDTPDWCSCEGGLIYDPATPPSGEEMSVLRSMSPIIYASKVRAPVLLYISGKDLRCPPSQGFLYYNTLKALGKKVRLLYYPNESHPIPSVSYNADAFINTALWFHDNTK